MPASVKTIINLLKEMVAIEKSNKQYFKIRAYNTVIENLQHHFDDSNVIINEIEDLDEIEGVGKGIKKRIEEIIQNGSLEEVVENDETDALKLFQSIHGIGPVKAKWLIEKGARSIDDLKTKKAARIYKLNDSQLVGIKYHEEFQKRIDRDEMDKHNQFIYDVLGTLEEPARFNIAGSYRRGLPDSGDIDVILTSRDLETAQSLFNSFIKELQRVDYVTEVLALGDSKFMGVAKLPSNKKGISRRIDVMVCSPQQYPFALLYFTGSQSFNIGMRKHALKMGYSLSEYGLKPTDDEKANKANEKRLKTIKKERDIFDFLGIDYVKPTQRLRWNRKS